MEVNTLLLLMQAALSTLLLIIYNCSDQVLTTRERRVAKSREAAARSARKTANARQRWQFAKDATKKGATGLQAQLSRTFKKDAAILEKVKFLKQPNSEADIELLSHSQPTTSSMVASSSVATKKKGKEPSDLMQIIHEIENDPDIDDNINTEVETRAKSVTENVSKGKQPHTHSQIFKYAYSQLEKEKAQQQENKKLTFSGVIKMATNTERRKRPLIEISFKDLTLTLKAQNKHILRYVTGKIKPGRITAVMGPSGAGKTTFLSALAGKALGCSVTGSILINGRNESIHSFKKITGFVPQDDVVHGNLTVEENLWFSAQCRYITLFDILVAIYSESDIRFLSSLPCLSSYTYAYFKCTFVKGYLLTCQNQKKFWLWKELSNSWGFNQCVIPWLELWKSEGSLEAKGSV